MEEASWFPGRLRELREAAGLTQQQLAERCGVKWAAVSRWERGAREPSWSNVVAIVKALGADCSDFLRPPGPRTPAGPGRPPKARASGAGQPADAALKRPRGRPRKKADQGAGAAGPTGGGENAAAGKKGRRQKGG